MVTQTMEQVDAALGVHKLEYDKLKGEQAVRLAQRDNLIYATLTATVLTGLGALQTNPLLLLVLAPVGALLGWTYIINDDKIKSMGRYMRTHLLPRMEELVAEPVLGWETDGNDPRRTSRKVLQLATNLLAFAGPGTVGIAVAVAVVGPTPLVLAAVVAAAVMLLVLGWQIIVYADLTSRRGL